MNYNSDDEIVELFYSVAKISRYTPEGVRGLPAFIGQYRRLRLLDEMGLPGKARWPIRWTSVHLLFPTGQPC